MSDRQRPPNRRPSITREVVWKTETAQHSFHVTIGLDEKTARPVEVFYADGQRNGSQLQHAIQDACVLISLLLQHGVDPATIAKSLSTTPVLGTEMPSSVIGVIANDILRGVIET
ncbi:hypothetical protein [uncultured Sulfitobacter sp.]|uniref:TSCPD domain-containing protein n=1 Tax=uncultured Sulfitobacter sp. TaxID=191468 RepID=UPI0030FB5E4A